MDPLLLKYYNRELQFIREMGGEFAREFPKVAGRLGMDGTECADPYVERLLEGFGFLAARVQLNIDAKFPRFSQHLLEIAYPHYLAPTPSMTVVQFQPQLAEGALGDGIDVPRDTLLKSILGKGDRTPCQYRTAHPVKLWPIEIAEAEYFSNMGAVSGVPLSDTRRLKAGLRFRLKTTAGMNFSDLPLDSLQVFLRGRNEQPMRLYEQLIGNATNLVLRSTRRPSPWNEVLDPSYIRQVGFDDDQALLPHGPRSFSGYRLLHEYFTFPERYLFVEFGGLQQALQRCEEQEVELIALFDRYDSELENAVGLSDFALFCSPAINLFPKRADRLHLTQTTTDFHVVPDRTRPLDFEVFEVTEVVGHGGADQEVDFLPFYACNDLSAHAEHMAFYTLQRERRILSTKQRKHGPRSSYIGSESYISLVDTREAPYPAELKQLAIQTLCTNRDLPLQMPVGKGKTDFTMEMSVPVEAVRCLRGPTRPRPSLAHNQGEMSWRLINQLSLNYLSLMDDEERGGAAALRELLSLYGEVSEATVKKQIEGIKSVVSDQVTRRIPVPGPIAFGRGLEVTVSLDETAFEGTGVFLLGSVLDQFFARYVSINSFTETVIKTVDRGEVMRWPVRIGQRQIL